MYELAKVETAADWQALHAIRREVLFDTGVFPFVYDENRPEDREAGNTPYLLLLEGSPIGVLRLDRSGAAGVVRLVAITASLQRRGHGRAMSDLLDAEAGAQGITELRVNAFKDAIGFYEALGWTRAIWDAEEDSHLAAGNVQMIKVVRTLRR